MTLKVFSIAVDGRNGTTCGAYVTEREAYLEIIKALDIRNVGYESTAINLANAGDFELLRDYLEKYLTDLETWNIDEQEIEFPIVGELADALRGMLEAAIHCDPHFENRWSSASTAARAALSKAKGETAKTTP